MSDRPLGERRIATHPAQRAEQLVWANQVLRETAHHDADTLCFACEVILLLSRDPAERTVAQELQRQWRKQR